MKDLHNIARSSRLGNVCCSHGFPQESWSAREHITNKSQMPGKNLSFYASGMNQSKNLQKSPRQSASLTIPSSNKLVRQIGEEEHTRV